MVAVKPWLYIVLVFVVTALYDGGLQLLNVWQLEVLNTKLYFPVLSKYFDMYNGATAMALAGSSGIIAAAFAQSSSHPQLRASYVLTIAGCSAAVGLAMKYGRYAPPLDSTYYGQPVQLTLLLDALSGVIVVTTILALVRVR